MTSIHSGRLRSSMRRVLLATVVFASLLPTGVAAAEDNGPVSFGGSVTPTSLDSYGGQVSITASGLDDYGIFMFYADVNGPDVFVENVQMWPSNIPENPNDPHTYSGVFNVPANYRDYPVSYYFNSTITDFNGQTAGSFLGEVTVAAAEEFDEAPSLWEPDASPRNLPNTGGSTKLGVSTFDDSEVASAAATLTARGATPRTVELSAINANRFEASTSLPANASSQPVSYTLQFSATDDAGQTTTIDGGTVTVAAAGSSTALLQLSPTAALLGPTRAGRTSRHNVVVRNTGKPGTGSVDAAVTASGPFAVVSGGSLQLVPGQSKVVVVEFRPKRAGLFSGRVTVTRGDSRQRPLAAALTGLALP